MTIRVTAAIIIHDNRVVVARRAPGEKLAGKWEFPGGKIEPGETPEKCLARELAEEFSIQARVGEFVASSTCHYDHDSIELLAYRVEHIAGDIRLSVHDQLAWVLLSELHQIDFAAADIPLAKAIVGGL